MRLEGACTCRKGKIIMRANVIKLLTAPGGGSPLEVGTIVEREGKEIIRGTVLSPEEGLYPIREGILNLLPQGVGSLSPAQVSNQLWPTAQFYERPWRSNTLTMFSGESFPFSREQPIFYEMLGHLEGGLWLDLAASTALYGRWLAPHLLSEQGEVIVLDYAWPMMRRARHFVQKEGHPNISLVLARGESLPFATGSVDGVVCGGSLNEFGIHHVAEVLQESARVIRSGGVALFMHLLTAQKRVGQLLQRYMAEPGGIAFWDRQETNNLFTKAGFIVQEERDFGVVAFTRLLKP